MTDADAHAPDEILVGFTRALRAAGVPVTPDRTRGYLAAVALVGLDSPRASYDAGRATLCGSPDDLVRYDQVFHAYFDARDGLPRARRAERPAPATSALPLTHDDDAGGDAAGGDDPVRAMASGAEVLRHRDVAGLTTATSTSTPLPLEQDGRK